ncbi:probably inactive leucine-rich repeat receptor-like protein kinase At5g48380 [Triticum dicoccoides]|uniref:probably inactive leucine-rich repeat receptor-like protein kinase At5g48380 n=1 Tax=Triticum dicoccoides TaxID=85692 RepID=UPI00188DFC41|nr:probably inactive leucine-rich repeat receptor-like protein kinase At5g48380 [Triticum dicoccoides]
MAKDTKFLLLFLLLSSSSSLCFGSEQDIQCLRSVQQSVIDPLGVLKSSWNFGYATDGYICSFTGVQCWQGSENMVLSLLLENLGLEGPFPRGLQNCTSLNILDLLYNNFSAPIPFSIAQQISYVTSLNLSYNNFSGEIPESMENLAYLNTFNLQHNQLRGQILERFSVLGRLTSFNVADNLLSGPIPTFPQDFSPLYFAGNQDLCGAPLDECPRSQRWTLRRINGESSVGAAVGFVLGFVVAFYFHLYCCERLLPYVFHT